MLPLGYENFFYVHIMPFVAYIFLYRDNKICHFVSTIQSCQSQRNDWLQAGLSAYCPVRSNNIILNSVTVLRFEIFLINKNAFLTFYLYVFTFKDAMMKNSRYNRIVKRKQSL